MQSRKTREILKGGIRCLQSTDRNSNQRRRWSEGPWFIAGGVIVYSSSELVRFAPLETAIRAEAGVARLREALPFAC